MAREILFVFLFSLVASSILAKPVGKDDDEPSGQDVAEDFFDAVKEKGVMQEPNEQPKRAKERPKFTGSGHRVGRIGEETEVVPNTESEPEKQERGKIKIKLILWQQGFTVNGTELRPYEEEENQLFLQFVREGLLPMEIQEIAQQNPNNDFEFEIEDRRQVEYVAPKAPKPVLKPFEGKGNSLNGPSRKKKPVEAPPQDDSKNEENEKLANEKLNVDASQPISRIQVRLPDGTRLSVRLNMSHTVSDLRTYIRNARPQYAKKKFVLMTNFPNKELNNVKQTIEEAGLKNAAITLRLKE